MNLIKETLSKTKGEITFDDISNIDISVGIDNNIDNLKEDMLQIQYPNNLILDVGWYPSFNIKGSFQIQIIKDFDWVVPIFKEECKDWDILNKVIINAIQVCNDDQ